MRSSRPCTSWRASSAYEEYLFKRRLWIMGSPAERVHRTIRPNGRRQKPRPAEIVGPRGERQIIERGTALRETRHLLSDLPAVIRRERHALAAITHAMEQAVALTQMRHGVERIGDPSQPRVSDANRPQLREYLAQHRPQSWHAGDRIFFGQRGAAAEYDALAVRGRPEIHDD